MRSSAVWLALSMAFPGTALGRPSVSVAYLGDFATHPGVVVGVDAVVAEKARPDRADALVLAGNVGAYAHVRNHSGVLADVEIGWRTTLRSGFLVEAFGGVGYLHTFLGAPAWEVHGSLPVRVADPGRPAFMPVLTAGVGWDFDVVTPFVRVGAFGQFPFNHNLLPHLALVAGVRF